MNKWTKKTETCNTYTEIYNILTIYLICEDLAISSYLEMSTLIIALKALKNH